MEQHKYKNIISEIPSTAVDVYRMLPEGTICEVISNTLFFQTPADHHLNYKNIFPEIPTTALEVYRMLPEGTRCEVIFNILIMSPSPTSFHQLLLSDLHVLIYSFLKEKKTGKVIPAPFDVYFENYNSVVQPDLLIVLDENLYQIKEDGLYGIPAVIIEILSHNKAYVRKRKRELYEKADVREYFMIDPKNKNTTLLTLNAQGVYVQKYEQTGILISEILGCRIEF